jgi:hypothetical protein
MNNTLSVMHKIIDRVCIEYNLGEIEVIECNMFACEPLGKVLYITDEEDEIEYEGNNFLEGYLYDKFGIKIPRDKMYIFSVLHELGHIITFPHIDEEAYWREASEEDELDFLGHRQIYGEYVADVWAIEYIKNNMEVIVC